MKLFRSTLLVSLLLAWTTAVQAENLAVMKAMRGITQSELKTYVDLLADDTFEGRNAGSRGGRAAGNYLIEALTKHGWKPAGDTGYVQSFAGPPGSQGPLRNIVGILEGSDPELKNEVIVVGAHYDHVGYGTSKNSRGPIGFVHNGADDNASGVSALLEMMQAFAAAPRPKRSVMLAFWDGEEAGLLGSKHWTAHPTIDLDRIKLMINVDMIGRLRDRKVVVYGWRSSSELRRLVTDANGITDLGIDFDWEMKDNSDHHSFYLKKIPVLMLHTGLHDDYHTPHDDAHLINTAGMEEVARLMFQITYQAASQPREITYRVASETESKSAQKLVEAPLAPPRPRFGVQWKNVENGIEITDVRPGLAGARSGFRRGDRIEEIAGQKVTDSRHLLGVILTADQPTEMLVHRPGLAEPLRPQVQFDGSPIRIGVSWRVDDADPQSMFVTQVIVGSPAYWAGLQVLDRIRAVNGQEIASSAALLESLSTLPGPIEVLLEREGRSRRVVIEPPAAKTRLSSPAGAND